MFICLFVTRKDSKFGRHGLERTRAGVDSNSTRLDHHSQGLGLDSSPRSRGLEARRTQNDSSPLIAGLFTTLQLTFEQLNPQVYSILIANLKFLITH